MWYVLFRPNIIIIFTLLKIFLLRRKVFYLYCFLHRKMFLRDEKCFVCRKMFSGNNIFNIVSIESHVEHVVLL